MQPSQKSIAQLPSSYNRKHTVQQLPLLPELSSSMQTAVREAFFTPIHAGITNPHEIVKAALTHLRGQMQGPWLPTHQGIRAAILAIIAHSVESLDLATALLSREGGRNG
jgi:hypothetical protein